MQNCASPAFCAPHLLQNKVSLMTGHYRTEMASCQKLGKRSATGVQNLPDRTNHIAHRQLQPTEFRMIVHAQRIGNIQPVARQ